MLQLFSNHKVDFYQKLCRFFCALTEQKARDRVLFESGRYVRSVKCGGQRTRWTAVRRAARREAGLSCPPSLIIVMGQALRRTHRAAGVESDGKRGGTGNSPRAEIFFQLFSFSFNEIHLMMNQAELVFEVQQSDFRGD